jgi:hypothetical protein
MQLTAHHAARVVSGRGQARLPLVGLRWGSGRTVDILGPRQDFGFRNLFNLFEPVSGTLPKAMAYGRQGDVIARALIGGGPR